MLVMAHEFIGKKYRFDYGNFVAIDEFTDTEIIFEVLAGPMKGLTGQVAYKAQEIAPRIYAISWQEADGATVVHVNDFEKMISLSFFTSADKQFFQMKGAITEVD